MATPVVIKSIGEHEPPAKVAGVGRFVPTTAQNTNTRLSLLLWGLAGVGKTVFASTAPKKVLILSFDPDGPASLEPSDDVLVIDFASEASSEIVKGFAIPNGRMLIDLEKYLVNNPDIKTVVVDSVTMFSERAVHYAVTDGKAPGATFDNPGPAAYGVRSRYINGLFSNVLAVTRRHGKHVIFVCHEDTPNKGGSDPTITVQLGGGLVNEVAAKLSEMWNIRDEGKGRRVLVRPVGFRKPMKTRMLDTREGFEFVASYDQYTGEGLTLEMIFNAWKDGGYKKLPIGNLSGKKLAAQPAANNGGDSVGNSADTGKTAEN